MYFYEDQVTISKYNNALTSFLLPLLSLTQISRQWAVPLFQQRTMCVHTGGYFSHPLGNNVHTALHVYIPLF